MRFASITLVFLSTWVSSLAQIYLDTLYDFGGVGNPAIEVHNTGAMERIAAGEYRTAIGSRDPQNLGWNIVITAFDTQGNLSNTIRIGDSTEVFWPMEWIELSNDTMVLLARYDRPYDVGLEGYQYGLLAFDINTGEVHWQREYGEPNNSDTPFGLEYCSNGDFVLTGSSYSYVEEDNSVYTVRVDHGGDQIWESYQGGSESDIAHSVFETVDDGFLIAGRTRSFGAGDYDFYLLKLTSNGDLDWYETYGQSQIDVGFGMTRLLDGNLVMFGSRGGDSGWLLKVDQSGQQIWSKPITDFPYYEIYGLRELANGDLLNYGICIDPIDGTDAGCACLTNSSGQILWKRVYNRSIGVDYLTNGTQLDDGGFLFIGQARNTNNNTSDAWVLVVDSAGCEYPECITGIDERDKFVLVNMWPNPASEVLNIQVPSGVQGLNVRITDMTGKQVYRSRIDDLTDLIDVSGWSKGLYVINGQDAEGRGFSQKFVKE